MAYLLVRRWLCYNGVTTQMTQIKQREKGHYPIKATKSEVIRFIHDREFVTVHDLIERFGYKYKGAEIQSSIEQGTPKGRSLVSRLRFESATSELLTQRD